MEKQSDDSGDDTFLTLLPSSRGVSLFFFFPSLLLDNSVIIDSSSMIICLTIFILLTACVASLGTVSAGKVLVLGAGGLVGRHLTTELSRHGHVVTKVSNRLDIDLRFQTPPADTYDFAFFLACEVGGSKFLTKEFSQAKIWHYNSMIYDVVFPFLRSNNIPFLFSSSMLSGQPSAYGQIKLRGESLTATSNGKIVRFFDVFGTEFISSKSHSVSDWAHACARGTATLSLTDGKRGASFPMLLMWLLV